MTHKIIIIFAFVIACFVGFKILFTDSIYDIVRIQGTTLVPEKDLTFQFPKEIVKDFKELDNENFTYMIKKGTFIYIRDRGKNFAIFN